jgi:hypothetical protein
MDEEERIFRKVRSIVRQDNRSTYIGEDDLVRLTQRGITVNFHLKHEKLDIINIFRTIKRTQRIVRDKLAHDLEEVRVNIYKSGEEMLRDGGLRGRYSSWAAGFFDGEITIVSEEDNEEEAKSLYIYLTHEIVHLAVHEISSGRCPFWLDEGLAVYLSQELPDLYLETIRSTLEKDGVLLDLRELERPDPSIIEDEDSRRLAYAEAACMVECMVNSPLYRWRTVNTILCETGTRETDDVLFDLCLDYDLIQGDLEKWARKKIAEGLSARERIL